MSVVRTFEVDLRKDLLYGMLGPLNRHCFDYGRSQTRASEVEKIATKLRDVERFIDRHLSGEIVVKGKTIQELFDCALLNAVRKSALDCLDMQQKAYVPQPSDALNKAYIEAHSTEEDDLCVIENCKSIQEQSIAFLSAWRDNPSLVFSSPLQDSITELKLKYIRDTLLPKVAFGK